MDIQTQVIAIVAEQALMDPSDIAVTDTMADIGLDSLGLVECIFAIEETFDVTVPFNANVPSESDFDISSVGTVIAGVQALISQK